MSVKAGLNRAWRTYNAGLLRAVAPFPSTTVLDPYFLYQFHFNRNLRAVAPSVGGLVVDIGCGRKPYRGFLTCDRYVGVDLPYYSGGMQDVSPAADAYGDAVALPLRDVVADAVVAFQVLEHTPKPREVIKEAYRVLKPRGALLLTVPQSYPIHGEPHDYFRYTAYGIRHLLEEAGFRVVSIRQNGHFGSYMGLMLNKYLFQHFAEFRSNYLLKAFLGLCKILLTPVLLLLVFVVNLFGLLVDALHRDPYFTSNYTVLARK